MTDPTRSDIERRALALLEMLADQAGDPQALAGLLENEHPAIAERVRQITGMASRRDAMPTDLGQAGSLHFIAPPERFGPYRFVAPVGHGGMGEVWRGERADGLFDQVVAIKLIQPHLQVRAGEAFESERRILARFEHPGIARLIDGGTTEDGRSCLVMEFVDGAQFDVACSALPLSGRIGLFRQALLAVCYAHGRLVAHGDLKPSNILVDGAGRVRLLDFGIARLITDEASAFLLSGAVTSSFASPARLAGEPPSITDDVFALGRLLALIVGTTADVDLAAIIAKATAKDPTARYASTDPLLADLDNWQAGRPVSARPDSLGYRTAKFVARNRVPVIAATLAILVLAGTTVVATIASFRAERAQAKATARYEETHGIANYLLFDVMQRLSSQPNSLKLRTDIAATAQGYLDRLAALPDADDTTRIDTAKGLRQLAAYQGKPGAANIDRPQAARENLRKALGLVQPVAGDAAKALSAAIILDQETIAANTDNDLKLANRLLAQAHALIFARHPPDPGLAAAYYSHKANLVSWEGDSAGEIAAAEAGLELPRAANDKDAMATEEMLLDQLEEGWLYARHIDRMLPVAQKQMYLAEAMHRRWPEDQAIVSRLVGARYNVGVAFNELGRYDEALQVLTQGSAEAKAAAQFEPLDRWAEAEWRSIDSTRAQALAFLHRYDEAMAIDHTWTARALAQWQADPANQRRMRGYVEMLAMTGEAQELNRRYVEECRTDAQTLAVYQKMRSVGALTQADLDMNVKLLNQRMAKNCKQTSAGAH